MATTFSQPGYILEWTNGTGVDVSSGDLVIVRSGTTGMSGVALTDIANGATGSVAIAGVYTVSKASGAVSKYALVYRNSSAAVTTTATGNTLAGVAIEAGTTAATTLRVLLNGLPGPDIN